MTEGFLQILLYIYSKQLNISDVSHGSNTPLLEDLLEAGFSPGQTKAAIKWLQQLKAQSEGQDNIKQISEHAFRVFTEAEQRKLTYDARGFILFLEQAKMLDINLRELLIDSAMALDLLFVDSLELRCLLNVVLLPHLAADPTKLAAFNLLFTNNRTVH